jgi:hypothetical protein
MTAPWTRCSNAVREAAQRTIGSPEDAGWIPHVTVAYSTSVQPGGPIIAALGRELPECKITISSVSLIAQQGAERLWEWRPVADIQLGPTAAA